MGDRSEIASMRAALALDPEAVLVRDPALLLDPDFLGSLQAELVRQLGPEEAALTLLQIGFLHGLRDAARVLAGAPEGPRAATLPVRFRRNPAAQPPGAIEILGCWPEHQEAAARLMLPLDQRTDDCRLSAGYTSGWLSAIFDVDMLARETSCVAAGAEACRFVAREVGVWRAAADVAAGRALEALPFGALRDLLAADPAGNEPGLVGSHEPVVHIWGPVMVIPYAGVDEALLAVELLGRDPEAGRVSVIVIDLTSAVIDEAFGAAALEQILERIECWGVEAIFAGVSNLSLRTVAGLDRQPLMVHKDLHGAIAAAFQIAQLRTRPV